MQNNKKRRSYAHLFLQIENEVAVIFLAHVLEWKNDLVLGVHLPNQNALCHGATLRHIQRALQLFTRLLFGLRKLQMLAQPQIFKRILDTQRRLRAEHFNEVDVGLIEPVTLLPLIDQLTAAEQLIAPGKDGNHEHAARAKSRFEVKAIIKSLVLPCIRNIEHALVLATSPSQPSGYFERRSARRGRDQKTAGVLRRQRRARNSIHTRTAEKSRYKRSVFRGQRDIRQEQRGPVRVEQDANALEEHVQHIVHVALVACEKGREVGQQLTVVAHVVPLLERLAVAYDLVHPSQQHVHELAVNHVEHGIVALLPNFWPLIENADGSIHFVLVPHWRAQYRVRRPPR